MSDALAAALLATQRRRDDPTERSRRYGQMLLQQGAAMAPVQSVGEGLARALTGVAGGVFEGMADREQETKNKRLIEGLTQAYGAPDEASRMAALKGLGDDGSGVLAPFLASMLSQKVADERKNKILDTKLDASGLGGGQQGPLTIDITPLPAGTTQPGAFGNNLGNIRATNISWDGKGAPQNGFETFATPQQGANAMAQNLRAYVQQNPGITVAQAIAKWAPPNENNTQQYISQVAEGTGINPGMPLAEVMGDPVVGAQLLDAIARKEKGGLPPGVTADTFMAATGGAFQPGTQSAQSMPLPQMPTQGSSEGQPSPVVPAQAQGQPQMSEVSPAAQQFLQEAQRLRAGGDREGALKMVEKARESQALWMQERAKTMDQRTYAQSEDERKRAADRAEHDRQQMAVRGTEMEKLRTARAEGDAIIAALKDFEKEFPKAGVKSLLGSATPANTAYNNAALLAKGEALFNLGVLNGPDLDIIRKTLPDPSTLMGWKTSEEDMRTAVSKVINLINTRIAAKEKALGVGPQMVEPQAAAPQAGGAPTAGTVMDGYRFKGGDPSKQENWEPVR